MEQEIKCSSEMLKICHSLPKTELHAHLNGSIRRTTLLELLNEGDREEVSKLFQNQMSFDNAFKIFKISSKVVTGLDIISRITREMIEDWAKANCIYLEIRTSIKAIGGRSKEDYLRTVLEEIYKGNQKFEMQTRLIISLNRELPIEDYLDTLEIYKNFPDDSGMLKPLIVGIDYSGYEANEKHKYADVIPIFQKFRDLGLGVTIHMGEIKNYQILDYSQFKPDRISHTYFFQDHEYYEIMKNKIPIEVCPSGSYSVKNLTSYKEINLKNYYKKSIKNENSQENSEDNFIYDLYCINTDDTMLFITDLSQEYFEAAVNFGMSGEEMKQMVLRAVDFIFEKNEEFRNNLKNKIKAFNV